MEVSTPIPHLSFSITSRWIPVFGIKEFAHPHQQATGYSGFFP